MISPSSGLRTTPVLHKKGTNHSVYKSYPYYYNNCKTIRNYKESRRESNNSSWHSSQPLAAKRSPVSSSSANSWLTGSVMTLGVGGWAILSGLLSDFVTDASNGSSSSQFSASVSPQIDMFDKMLCLRSPVFCEGRYRLVFRTGLCTALRFFGTRTVRLDRRFERRDSSRRSRSNFQKPPLPGSSFERAIFTKHLFRDKLCLIEFYKRRESIAIIFDLI